MSGFDGPPRDACACGELELAGGPAVVENGFRHAASACLRDAGGSRRERAWARRRLEEELERLRRESVARMLLERGEAQR